MTEKERFDLVVVGAGPAGEKAAAQAAYFGKRVAVVERARLPGGAAVHTGTLPSKTLRETAIYLSGHRSRKIYGLAVELERDATLQKLMSRKAHIAEAEASTYRENLDDHDVHYIEGHGRLRDPHTVAVTTQDGVRLLEGEFILIATGSVPRQPAGIDFADPWIHDSDEILEIEALPSSLTVLGGGVIGCEYACMFAALRVPVTVVDARPEILPFIDGELVARLKEAMEHLGIRFVQGQRWGDVRRTTVGVRVELSDGTLLEHEQLLFAAGRTGNTGDLGLDALGLSANGRGYLDVDDAYRTAVPSVLAAGDVIGFPALASVSMEQGRVAICRAFGFPYKQAVAEKMPLGIYTIPEVSSFGLSEEAAREQGVDVVVGRAHFRDNARGKITGDLEGLTKLVVERESRRVVGVHVIGERASELVHIGQVAIHLEATVDLFIDMVFNYPTLADSYKYAAYGCLQALNR